MRAIIALVLALAGCCPYERAGELRVVGSAIGENSAEHPELLLLFDEGRRCFVWVKRAYWESLR